MSSRRAGHLYAGVQAANFNTCTFFSAKLCVVRYISSLLLKWVPADCVTAAAVAMQCAWFGETAGANAAAARARWYQAGNDGRHGCGCARPAEFQDGCYAPSCGCGAAGALNTSWPS